MAAATPVTPVTARPAPAVDHGGLRAPADRRRTPVSVRLSAQERAAVVAAAAAQGQPPTAYIRRAALTAAGQPTSPLRVERDALAQETARAVGQLGRIGSLANQIAAAANSVGLTPAEARVALDRVARELTMLRGELVGRTGERRRG